MSATAWEVTARWNTARSAWPRDDSLKLMGTSIRAHLRHLTAATVLAAAAFAQTPAPPPSTTLVEPPTPLLPDSIGEWKQVTASRGDFSTARFDRFCTPVAAGAVSEGGETPCAAILKEDGLNRYAIASYTRGGASVEMFAEQFVDATGAYSAFSYYRALLKAERLVGPAAGHTTIETLADSAGTVTWAGSTVVRIKGTLSKDDQAALIAGLPKVTGRKAIAPLLPSLLPLEVSGTKLDPPSIHYALGPVAYRAMGGTLPPEILGWEKSAEVVIAGYSGRAGRGNLTLLLYPTPQIAGDRGRAIEKAINDAGVAGFGTVKLFRNGPLLSLSTGGFKPDQAEKLVHAPHLNEQVSFDQKMPLEFHAEVRKTATLLQSILIFTGLLIIAAIVIGVFLGGIRAGWRVMHGKPAHSEPEFLTIDLRDKPKALFGSRESDPDNTSL